MSKTYSRHQISKINASRLAVQDDFYLGEDGLWYLGTKENILKEFDKVAIEKLIGQTPAGSVSWEYITGNPLDNSDLNSLFDSINTDILQINTELAGKQDTITLGTSLEYFKGDLSLGTFSTDVRSQVSATSPLNYNNVSGQFTITPATTATSGYLSDTDWNIFNGKLSTTLTSTKIFVGNGSNVATGVFLTLDGAGGAFSLSNAGVLTMPNANASTRGLLLAADFVTFSNKPSGSASAANTLTYWSSTSAIADSTWTYSSGRVGVPTNGALSNPVLSFTGSIYTGGSSTTTKPLVLIEQGATSDQWSTLGTAFGINAASGFTGKLVSFMTNGLPRFDVDGGSGATLYRHGANANAPTLSFQKGRATSGNLYSTGIINGDELGRISFFGANNASYTEGARIYAASNSGSTWDSASAATLDASLNLQASSNGVLATFLQLDGEDGSIRISKPLKNIGAINMTILAGRQLFLQSGETNDSNDYISVGSFTTVVGGTGASGLAILGVVGTFAPTSSSVTTYSSFRIKDTLNQTSTATADINSIRINPTFTSVQGTYYGVHITLLNTSVTGGGTLFGFKQTGTAGKNSFEGWLGLNTTTKIGTELLRVNGTSYFDDVITILDSKGIKSSTTTTGIYFGAATDKICFYNGTPVAIQTLAAYTTDPETIAYTGIDNTQPGTVYATVADLNQLRLAYENLRLAHDDGRSKLINTNIYKL